MARLPVAKLSGAIAVLIGVVLLPQVVTGSSDSCPTSNAPCSAENTAPPKYSGPTVNDFIESQSTSVYFDQYQMVGSHNSYHQQPDTGIVAPMTLADYSQPSLSDQLDSGVRELELDLHFSEGHFEVYHVKDIDDLSSCKCLSDCLSSMKRWSDANPDHTPVVVSLEPKGFNDPLEPLWCDPEESACAQIGYDIMRDQIVAQFCEEEATCKLILPGDIRGSHSSMRQALAAGVHSRSVDCDCESADCDCQEGGWPTVDKMLGKFVLYLNFDENNEGCRAAYEQQDGLKVFFDMAKGNSVDTDSRFSAFVDFSEERPSAREHTGYIARQTVDDTLDESAVAAHADKTAANIFAFHSFSDLEIDSSRDFEDSHYWSMAVIAAAALLCLCVLYCCVPIFSSSPPEDKGAYEPAFSVET